MNYIVGNSQELWPVKPGSMGRPYPGHRVAVIDPQGRELGPGEVGDVAVHRTWIDGTPDPVFFLGYWRNPEATSAKYSGEWCRTGDEASLDEDGYLWYQGRADDVFKSAGYRIGPSEIENCVVEAPGGGQLRRGPDARRDARRPGEGLRGARPGTRALGGPQGIDPGAREAPPGPVPAAPGNRVRGAVADDHHGQGAAKGAARPRGAASYFFGSTDGVNASQ